MKKPLWTKCFVKIFKAYQPPGSFCRTYHGVALQLQVSKMDSSLFANNFLPEEYVVSLSPLTNLTCKDNTVVFEKSVLTAENSPEINHASKLEKTSSFKSGEVRWEPEMKRTQKRWESDRRRVQAEKEGYKRLCEIVPNLVLKRPTKIEILKETILYIKELQRDVEKLEKEDK